MGGDLWVNNFTCAVCGKIVIIIIIIIIIIYHLYTVYSQLYASHKPCF